MAEVNLRSTSWLQFARLLNIEGVVCWEATEFPVIEEADDDRIHTVGRMDRIDILADVYLESPLDWWMIATLNNLNLLPNDLYTNQTIRIPSQNRASAIRRQAAMRREGR